MNTSYALAWVVAVLLSVQSRAVEIAWNPVANATGYKAYYGSSSGYYTNITSVGNVTNVVVPGLVEGMTYYFVVTTLDQKGLESRYSSEISYTVPCTNCPTMETNIIYAGVYQLCVPTDVVFWPQFVKWTNYLPGWPPPTYFRLLLLSNNIWRYQASHDYKGTNWYGVFGTMKSSRKPVLMITNHTKIPVGTNYSIETTNESRLAPLPPP